MAGDNQETMPAQHAGRGHHTRQGRDAMPERHARHGQPVSHGQGASREQRLDELLRMLDAAAKGPEKVDSGVFMAGVIAKGNRIRDARGANADRRAIAPGSDSSGSYAAGLTRSLASMSASGELETAAIMLASVPFMLAGIAKPVYLLAGCAVSAGLALVRSLMVRVPPAKRGLR